MNKEIATCRGCGKILKGKPYYMGGAAYDPETNQSCKVNFYGGYVCSENCDLKSSREQEGSMPGNIMSKGNSLSSCAQSHLKNNWN